MNVLGRPLPWWMTPFFAMVEDLLYGMNMLEDKVIVGDKDEELKVIVRDKDEESQVIIRERVTKGCVTMGQVTQGNTNPLGDLGYHFDIENNDRVLRFRYFSACIQ